MKTIILAAAAVTALALPVAAQSGASPAKNRPTQAQAAMSARTFLDKAAAGDQFELLTSRLALEKATRPEIKAFAQTVVDDHTKNAQQLASVASRAGMAMTRPSSTVGATTGSSGSTSDSARATASGGAQGGTTGGSGSSAVTSSPDATASTRSGMNAGEPAVKFDAKQKQALDRLQTATGAEFDRLYVQAQADAHRETIALYRGYADKGENASLKTFAREALPTLQQHQSEVSKLSPRRS